MIGYVLRHEFVASSSCLQHASWAWRDRVIEWKVGVAYKSVSFQVEAAENDCLIIRSQNRFVACLVRKTKFLIFGGLCRKFEGKFVFLTVFLMKFNTPNRAELGKIQSREQKDLQTQNTSLFSCQTMSILHMSSPVIFP